MIDALAFLDAARERGIELWSGVPCSFLQPFIDAAGSRGEPRYVDAVSEGDAVAMAAGAALAGAGGGAMFQNSGLGNAVNPLASLCRPFRLPVLLVVTHRGAPGVSDEPQHEQMGRITGRLLDTLEIPWEPFPAEAKEIDGALERARDQLAGRALPYAFVMPKGAVAPWPAPPPRQAPTGDAAVASGAFARAPAERPARAHALAALREAAGGDTALLASTGKLGRELFALGHRPGQLYMVGSMGCISSLALGLCSVSSVPTVAIDGDGALLMRMGNLASVGHHRPRQLVHVVLDNEVHESTGGQPTVSISCDLAAVAAACGYRSAQRTDSAEALGDAVARALASPGPHFIHAKVAAGSQPDLPRPDRSPEQVRREFQAWLAG